MLAGARATVRYLFRSLKLNRARTLERLNGFDAEFYSYYCQDVGNLRGEAALSEHFLRFGQSEGRPPNADVLIADLETTYGPLPADFSPLHYRVLHSDLAFMRRSWELKAHYLRYGRQEQRAYQLDLSAHEREFAQLFERQGPLNDASAQTAASGSPTDMLDAAGVRPGPWLNRFILFEFAVLNASWLPRPPASRADGIRLFLQHGIERLAPIAIREAFDPAFYRGNATNPSAQASDADLYRDWLNYGILLGVFPNEGTALASLIGEDTFPDAFDETLYRALMTSETGRPGPGRFAALEHFVTTGFAILNAEVVQGPGSARLYEQIGEHHLLRGNAAIAVKAFNRALAIRPDVPRVRHRRGDTLLALDRREEAAEDFIAAAEAPDASVWSHVHAAELLAARPDGSPAALDRVMRSAPSCRHSGAWRAAGHRVVAEVFAATSRRATDLYAEGRRVEADACLTECLDRLVQVIPIIDPLPARLPAPREGVVVIMANRELPQCDHYRVVQKRMQLERAGWTVEIFRHSEGESCRLALDRACAAIFYRVYGFPEVMHAILYARALGIPTIYEIDDLLFDPAYYPDPFESFEGQITSAEYRGLQYGVPLFRYAMRQCEVGLASTPALAQAMRPLVRSGVCHVLRNGLDERNAPFLDRARMPFCTSAVTIFYGSGTKAHNRDFTDIAAPALLEVLGRHPHVRLVIAGYLLLDERFGPMADRILQLGFTSDVSAYWETLSGADINLAVLTPSPMSDAKSEIKWLEAAMCGIPSVVSATRTYREILVDGEDAFLARTPQDWSRVLDALVRDADLRERVGRQARAKAVREYKLDGAADIFSGFLPTPAKARPSYGRDLSGPATVARATAPVTPPRTEARCKPRLLVVAVYFPPQTVGGATRVVRDNVDHFLDHAADAFEIAIVATDLGAAPAYRTRIDNYRGVPVYRIAAPQVNYGEWRGFDPEMKAPFEALLDRFEPDLVHFHCVQHLTASVVEAVAERGLPYLITLHDAWWISDFQFLVDEDGQVRTPSSDPLLHSLNRRVSPMASIARRRELGRVMEGAAGLLAVSNAFADLYRAAGHLRTVAVPNGVSLLPRVERRQSATGRVRLGQIGGRTVHKGAVLIEAVLRTYAFERLSMTVVDHAYAGDYLREEVWGTTPVRIVGRVAQERVWDLYADLDVLLAPSLWPESFGLVTREARAAGLWVVASDRGAIGEEIVEGVDGFRVDPSSLDALRQVLTLIDVNSDRFLESPPPPPASPRTMADQGADLMRLYAEFWPSSEPCRTDASL
ncbi:glycosyltransferase [Methylobacterium sp. WL116]|nr:glycosyltransferase [Methylobacterium sp. WL116]